MFAGSQELAAAGIALSFSITTGYSVILGLSGGLTVRAASMDWPNGLSFVSNIILAYAWATYSQL